MKRYIFFFLLICLTGLYSENIEITDSLDINLAYYFPNHEGYKTENGFAPVDYSKLEFGAYADDPGRTVGSVWGAAENEFVFNRKIKIPFMQGDNSLTENNYFSSKSSIYISLVHTEFSEELSFSPASFFVLSAGSGTGTGWNAMGFNGLAKNLPGLEYDSPESENIEGIMYRFWGESTFQFDAEAFWPGEWHHIVLAVKSRIEYMAYTNADRNEAWVWKNDSGQNFNGIKFYGTYILGYKIPCRIDFTGIIADTEEFIDHNRSRSKLDDGGWGSDLAELKFGPMVHYKINDYSGFTALLQFKRFPQYTKESLGNRYFEYRESTGSTYISLYRLAMIYHCDF